MIDEDSDYEDAIEINPDAVNAMFRHPEDSECDTDDEEEEERLIEKINAMFDVDEDEEEEEEQNQFVQFFKQYLYRVVESGQSALEWMKNKADSIYNSMAKWIGPVYTYLTTKSQVEMVEDLMMTLENGDDAVHEYSKRITLWIAAKYVMINEKMNELRTMSKDRKSLHIRQEAALIKPSRAKRRRYGKVWKKHVDLSDGGIFSSLTNDSDSDSEESGDDAPETDLWDGGLFNSR